MCFGTLTCTPCANTGQTCVVWAVDEQKLQAVKRIMDVFCVCVCVLVLNSIDKFFRDFLRQLFDFAWIKKNSLKLARFVGDWPIFGFSTECTFCFKSLCWEYSMYLEWMGELVSRGKRTKITSSDITSLSDRNDNVMMKSIVYESFFSIGCGNCNGNRRQFFATEIKEKKN